MSTSSWPGFFRSQFHYPKVKAYFCGNSLGLQPLETEVFIQEELRKWADLGVDGHFENPNRWLDYRKLLSPGLASLCGAQTNEVVAMNSLTVNLHLMLTGFYRPEGKRKKILMEANAFSSDQYAIETHLKTRGLDPGECIVEIHPLPGHFTLSTKAVTQAIYQLGDELALVFFGGVHYYTGQFFEINSITRASHEVGAIAGFDLAHAIGNVPLHLHNWQTDFAVWCSYKYLNAGPGGVGGAFIHSRYFDSPDIPRLAGWWGHDESKRFDMKKGYIPMYGADGWQISNEPILSMAALRASLGVFEKTSMENLSEQSKILNQRLISGLEAIAHNIESIRIITPQNENERGCQTSILISGKSAEITSFLSKKGIITDDRKPDVVRISPVPLYNTPEEVDICLEALEECLNSLKQRPPETR